MVPPGSMPSAREIALSVRNGDREYYDAAKESLQILHEVHQELRSTITLLDELPTRPRSAQQAKGPLAGVPVLIKDQIDTGGLRTTYGSRIFKNHEPRVSAESVDRLERAGAIVVGKANLHEFAWGLTSRNPHWGNVMNPGLPELTPGGSSGGNAAAIAFGAVPLGLGTDTAGSLRVPAACCGVVGFKPTYDRVPRTGVFPLSPTLDTVGPIASSVQDCLLAFAVISGQTPVNVDVNRLRIAATTESLVSLLIRVGIEATLIDAPSPPTECAFILPFEAWAIHEDLISHFAHDYDPNVLGKLRQGSRVSESDYENATAAMKLWRQQTMRTKQYDVIIGPVLGIPIPLADVNEIEIRDEFGRNTRWVNLLGWAAVAIGSVQVAGPSDWEVLAVAEYIEPLIRGR